MLPPKIAVTLPYTACSLIKSMRIFPCQMSLMTVTIKVMILVTFKTPAVMPAVMMREKTCRKTQKGLIYVVQA